MRRVLLACFAICISITCVVSQREDYVAGAILAQAADSITSIIDGAVCCCHAQPGPIEQYWHSGTSEASTVAYILVCWVHAAHVECLCSTKKACSVIWPTLPHTEMRKLAHLV
jgi:hypothetical protein